MIVLCIAVGVTAYGLANPTDNVFTSLPGFTPEDDSNNGDSLDTGDDGSGAGGSGAGGSSPNSSDGSGISSFEAKNIANNHIDQKGYYAGNPTLNNGNWYIPILDPEGNHRGFLEIDSITGEVIGGAGGVS
jgi:hypothetical protein